MSSADLENRHFVAGGTVQAGAGVYIQRAADEILLDLCRKGEFAYVLTSRQMGKSSLMVNAAERLIQDGIRPVLVDLTELGVEITADQWYRGLAEEIAAQLDLNTPLGEWWQAHEHLGIAQRFTNFLSDVVLNEIPQRIVIFIDEIDTTLRLDFTDDFFASIRYLYNARATDKDLTRISFVLLGVASPSDLIKDRERTPFNIGKRVELGDFQERDAVLGLGVETTLVQGVFHYTGGHPYLTLRVFHSLAERPLTTSLAERIQSLFFGEQAKVDSNLQFVRDSLTKVADRNSLLKRYLAVIKGKVVADKESDPTCVGLHLSGIVRGVGGFLTERNLIYSRVFDKNWARENREINWRKWAVWGTIVVAALLAIVLTLTVPLELEYRRLSKQEAVLKTKRRF